MKILIILTSCFLAMLTMLTNLPAQSQPDIMSGVLKIITPDNVREIDYYVPPGMEKCYESLANGQGSCPDSGGEYVIMAGLLTCLYHSPRTDDGKNLLGRLTENGWILSIQSDDIVTITTNPSISVPLIFDPVGGFDNFEQDTGSESGVLVVIRPEDVDWIDYYVPPGMEKCYESLANGQGSCPDSGGEYVIMAGLLTCLYHSPRTADNDNLLLGRLTSEGWIISAYSDVLPVELFSLNVPIHLDLLPLGGPSQNCVTCDGPQEGTPCSNIPGCRWVKKIGEQERWVDKGVKCADRSDRCPGYNPSAQHICNRKARLWCLEAKLCCADPPLNCGDPSGLCPNREKDEWLMKHLEAVVPPKACNDQPCLTTNPVTVPVID